MLGIVALTVYACCGGFARRTKPWTCPHGNAPCRRPSDRPDQPAPCQRYGGRLPHGARRPGAPAAALCRRGRSTPVHAGPQRARRRFRGRAGAVIGTAAAVHHLRHALGRSPHAAQPAPLDRLRSVVRTGHRPGRPHAGLSFPHQPHRPPASAGRGRDPCGQRHVLRHRRVCARGGLHAAHPDGPCPPIGARPPPPCSSGRRSCGTRGSCTKRGP